MPSCRRCVALSSIIASLLSSGGLAVSQMLFRLLTSCMLCGMTVSPVDQYPTQKATGNKSCRCVSLTVAMKTDISLFSMMLLAHRPTLVDYLYTQNDKHSYKQQSRTLILTGGECVSRLRLFLAAVSCILLAYHNGLLWMAGFGLYIYILYIQYNVYI